MKNGSVTFFTVLVDKPYTEIQPGEDGAPRKVWIFPVRPVPDNDVKKPAMFVFKDMEDFKTRGKDVDKQVKHKTFGNGTITAIEGTSIPVNFDKVGLKKMGYEFCMEKKMLEFI
ncbi:MAG: hypothetical protein SO415_00305 [Oliverpabstia sp.]|nr:hypothetical protein [Oliverpabstia sp.]